MRALSMLCKNVKRSTNLETKEKCNLAVEYVRQAACDVKCMCDQC